MGLWTADDDAVAPSARIGDTWAAIAAVDDPELRDTRAAMRDLLVTARDPLVRTERPGHFTGSALVVDASARRTLLLLHAKLGIWVQPGGHADGDTNLASVALREATEETGIEGLRIRPIPVDLDIHRVDPPAEDAHDHHDVRFLVMAPPGAVAATNHESDDHRWVDAEAAAAMDLDDGTRRLIRNGLAAAAELVR